MGGVIPYGGGFIAKVYRFIEESQKWEEFLKPMPTARIWPSVATTQSAIVASGGATGIRDDKVYCAPVVSGLYCATVEVYTSETSQWHTADPLPVPCFNISSVVIADTWYQLGGIASDGKAIPTFLCAPLTTLVQKATSPAHQSGSDTSVWKTLPSTPLVGSAAASISGSLLALGGHDENSVSQAVYVFLPLTNSWVRATTGDLPEPRYGCAAAQVSSNQLLVVGGWDGQNTFTKTAFLGSITI